MGDINTEGMAIAPGVVETIVSLAVRDVPGVASVGVATPTSGFLSLLTQRQTAPGVSVATNKEGELEVIVSLTVISGFSLTEIATNVRNAVADAMKTQVGIPVARVDIAVDDIQFRD